MYYKGGAKNRTNGYNHSSHMNQGKSSARRRKKSITQRPGFWILVLLLIVGGSTASYANSLPDANDVRGHAKQKERIDIDSFLNEAEERIDQEVASHELEEEKQQEKLEEKTEEKTEEEKQEESEEEKQEQLDEEKDTENSSAAENIYYFYNQLSKEEQSLYDEMLKGIENVDETILITCEDVEAMNVIIDKIRIDHAELFWWDGSYGCSMLGNEVTYTCTYTVDKSEVARMKSEIEAKSNELLNTIDQSGSQYEVIKQLYETVIETVTYVKDAPDNQNIYSSIVNEESVCAGYAREMQYLLNKIGIECLYVCGPIDTGILHAWNIVKCDGSYYQLDATYGDSEFSTDVIGGDTQGTSSLINYDYLCITDDQMYLDRKEEYEYTLPVCDSDDLNYHKIKGTYFDTYSEDIAASMEESINSEEECWSAQFANEELYQQVLQEVKEGLYAEVYGEYLEEQQYEGENGTVYMNDDVRWTITCGH